MTLDRRAACLSTSLLVLLAVVPAWWAWDADANPNPTKTAASRGIDRPRLAARSMEAAPPVEIAPPATAEAAPAVPPTPTPPTPLPQAQRAARPTPEGTGVWAVVVGINDYPGTGRDLHAAVADTTQVGALLDRAGNPPGQRRVLLNEDATGNAILEALDWLVNNAGPNSTAIVFYAGHARSAGGHESLVAADGERIADVVIADRLATLAAARTWIVLAACHAGGFTELLAPGRILTGGAAAGELAYERSDREYSYLVEYLIRRALLDGAAATDVQTAFAWAHDQLAHDYPDREPVQFDETTASFTLDGFRTIPPPAPRTESPPGAPPDAPERPAPDECRDLTLGAVSCRR